MRMGEEGGGVRGAGGSDDGGRGEREREKSVEFREGGEKEREMWGGRRREEERGNGREGEGEGKSREGEGEGKSGRERKGAREEREERGRGKV